MKKILLTILTIFLFISVSAQKQKATLYFKDGAKLNGLAKIKGERIKFRKQKKAKKQWFDYTNTKKLFIHEFDGLKEYHYKNIDGKATIKLLELLIEGKVTLYRIHSEGNHAMMVGGGTFGGGFNGGMMIGGSYSIDNYYVCRDNKDVAIHLGSTHLFSKNFKKAASKYFQDCPTLVQHIQNRKFKKKHIEEIVEYYNNNCN